MQVVDLKIENFRGIQDGYIRFGPHTMLIGPNNSGKTTIIEALALLFGRDRLVRDLTEHDFFGGNPQPKDRIRLVSTVIGFDGDNPSDYTDWFRHERGIIKWWDPESGQLHAVNSNSGWKLACQIAFSARFDRHSLSVETARYFHDDDIVADIFDDELQVSVPSKLIRDIGFFLVPAGRTWDKVLSFDSELFRRVINTSSGLPAQSVLEERDRLRTPLSPLEADPNLSPILNALNKELSGFFLTQPELKLRLTSTDSPSVLESVVPHYIHENGALLPARRHGSGLISLQRLLLLLQFGRQRSEANEGFWMALEEPELHVPPALQRRLVHRIQSLSRQTFVSTHSPMVAAMSEPTSLAIIRNKKGKMTSVLFLNTPLAQDTVNSIRSLFQLNRIDTLTAILHEVLLIPEGRTDYEWLKLILRIVDTCQGWAEGEESKFGVHVGIIPTHNSAVVASFKALSPLHPRVACLVDGDGAGESYISALLQLSNKPAIVKWPKNWMIEDVIGWLAEVDAKTVLASLKTSFVNPVDTIDSLVARLKTDDRSAHGLKSDQLAYEVVADAISTSKVCCERARTLMNGLAEVLLGNTSDLFEVDSALGNEVFVFKP